MVHCVYELYRPVYSLEIHWLSKYELPMSRLSRHHFSVQSNQFCAVQDAVCAVQDEKLCSPKITQSWRRQCEITGKVYINIQPLKFSMFGWSVERLVQPPAPKEVVTCITTTTAYDFLSRITKPSQTLAFWSVQELTETYPHPIFIRTYALITVFARISSRCLDDNTSCTAGGFTFTA